MTTAVKHIPPKVHWRVGYDACRDIDFCVAVYWGLIPEVERCPYGLVYRYGIEFGWQWLPQLYRYGVRRYRLQWERFFHFRRPRRSS